MGFSTQGVIQECWFSSLERLHPRNWTSAWSLSCLASTCRWCTLAAGFGGFQAKSRFGLSRGLGNQAPSRISLVGLLRREDGTWEQAATKRCVFASKRNSSHINSRNESILRRKPQENPLNHQRRSLKTPTVARRWRLSAGGHERLALAFPGEHRRDLVCATCSLCLLGGAMACFVVRSVLFGGQTMVCLGEVERRGIGFACLVWLAFWLQRGRGIRTIGFAWLW